MTFSRSINGTLGLCFVALVILVSCSGARPSRPTIPAPTASPAPTTVQTPPASSAGPVDERLLGTWQTIVVNEYGTWSFAFKPEVNGRYRTSFLGPFPLPDETGSIEARDGNWSLKKDSGETDGGTYTFTTPDTVVFQGQQGTLTWQRMGTGPTLSGVITDIAPSQSDWPPAGIPQMARKAREYALQWQPDAVLVALKAELLPNTAVGQYIASPQGRFSLVFIFCSSGTQKQLQITPNSPAGDFFEMGGADCAADEAIPDDFLDLPAAVEQARERGMRSKAPQEAELQQWRSGSSVGGVDVTGLAWLIRGSSSIDSQSYVIPSQPVAAPPIRQIDPCTLVTTTDAEMVIDSPVSASTESPTQGVWVCHYRSGRNPPGQVDVTVDENPARDRKGYFERERQRDNVIAIPDLGDGAYVFDSPAGFVQLTALVGDTLVEIMINSPSPSDHVAAVKNLAEVAVNRLISGEGISEAPAPQDEMVGEWRFEQEEERRLLRVVQGGAWNLLVATEATGVVTTEQDQWTLLSRARRPLLQGTYTLQGPDSLMTTGDIASTWTRVPAGQSPSGVDTTLLDPNLLGTGVGSAAGWPTVPVDAALVGLWRSASEEAGNPVELLWRINSTGPSFIQEVTSNKGYLEWSQIELARATFVSPQGHISWLSSARLLDHDHLEVRADDLTTQVWTRYDDSSLP